MESANVEIAVIKKDVQSSNALHVACSTTVKTKLEEQNESLHETREQLTAATSEIRAMIKTSMWFLGVIMAVISLGLGALAILE